MRPWRESRAARAIAEVPGPGIVRFAREATPVCTREDTPLVFGQANVIRLRREAEDFVEAFDTCLASDYTSENEDLTIVACGPMVPEAMRAAYILKQECNLETRIRNVHTVKPLDRATIVAAATDIRLPVTAEEHQVGGFGNLVAGAICQGDIPHPVKLRMVGAQDTFGESGQPWELMKFFGLTAEHLAQTVLDAL